MMSLPAPGYTQVRRVLGRFVRAVYRVEVVGAEHIPAIGPAVVVGNHESVLDPVVLGAAVEREVCFLGKSELWRFRPLGWALDGIGAIPIERGRGDLEALSRARRALEQGRLVSIFPQGAVRGDRRWRRGAARLALATGAPVIPVRFVGTARALSRGRIGFPRVRLVFGVPIQVAATPDDPDAATELTERLRLAVESLTWAESVP
jgi:1-acyl-sn-glycerol-3-phosphate acyltransferase